MCVSSSLLFPLCLLLFPCLPLSVLRSYRSDSPAMAAALAADPLPPLAGDIPPELDVPTDTALAELEAAYIAAKKKLLRKGLAELEAQGDGDAGKKKA